MTVMLVITRMTDYDRTDDGDDYLYDHSAAVYLYRADGSFKGTIVHNEPSEYMVGKIKSIL